MGLQVLDDNLSVPVVSAATAMVVMPHAGAAAARALGAAAVMATTL